MKIAIGGLAGCGKTTLGEAISSVLSIPHITFSFKTLAREKGVSLMEFQKMAEANPNIDREFDKMIYNSIKGKSNFIITTWLAPWYDDLFGVNYDLKIWLSTAKDIRAKRISGRENINLDEAVAHLEERDEENRDRYYSIYKINIFDNSVFDSIINNSNMTVDETVKEVLNMLKNRD